MAESCSAPLSASSEQKSEECNDVCVGPESASAGHASSCEGCPSRAACVSGDAKKRRQEMLSQSQKIALRLASVSHVLVVVSGKGGVGKSTVATQLALTFAHWGLRVGLCDVDICGPSVAKMTGCEHLDVRRTGSGWAPVYALPNLAVMSVAFLLGSKTDAVIWRGPRKTSLIAQFLCDVEWDALDVLIIDAPPGTSDEHISTVQLLQHATEGSVTTKVMAAIVTTPQETALLDVRKEISFCAKTKLSVAGVIENMSSFICPKCAHCCEIFAPDTGGALQMCREMAVPFIGSLPLDAILLRCASNGLCFVDEMMATLSATSPTLDAFIEITLSLALRLSPDFHRKVTEKKKAYETDLEETCAVDTADGECVEFGTVVAEAVDDDTVMSAIE